MPAKGQAPLCTLALPRRTTLRLTLSRHPIAMSRTLRHKVSGTKSCRFESVRKDRARLKLRSKCAIIIGASSGMGEATARRLAREGWRLALIARREDRLREIAADIESRGGRGELLVYPHDVLNYDDVPALFDRVVEELGGLSLIVYASGVMPEVEPDEYDFDKDLLMIETNYLGMVAWCNQAADLFTRLGGGCILGIGSVAGDRGRKDRPGYNASKGAQAIYLEALRNRLASRNVRVVTIKPGPVATPMTESLGDQPFMISANEAGRQIAHACHHATGEVYVPARWRWIMMVIRHIPSVVFRRLDL